MLHMRFAAEETINENHATPKNILIHVEFGWSFSVRRPVCEFDGRKEMPSSLEAGGLYTCSLLGWWGNTSDYFCRDGDDAMAATSSHVHYFTR